MPRPGRTRRGYQIALERLLRQALLNFLRLRLAERALVKRLQRRRARGVPHRAFARFAPRRPAHAANFRRHHLHYTHTRVIVSASVARGTRKPKQKVTRPKSALFQQASSAQTPHVPLRTPTCNSSTTTRGCVARQTYWRCVSVKTRIRARERHVYRRQSTVTPRDARGGPDHEFESLHLRVASTAIATTPPLPRTQPFHLHTFLPRDGRRMHPSRRRGGIVRARARNFEVNRLPPSRAFRAPSRARVVASRERHAPFDRIVNIVLHRRRRSTVARRRVDRIRTRDASCSAERRRPSRSKVDAHLAYT